jgi:hypothetical protein
VRKPEALSGATGSVEIDGEEGGALQAARVNAAAISDRAERRKRLKWKVENTLGTPSVG